MGLCVGLLVDGLFWAVTANRGDTQTQDSIIAVSIKATIILFVSEYIRGGVGGGVVFGWGWGGSSLFQSLFCLAYITIL